MTTQTAADTLQTIAGLQDLTGQAVSLRTLRSELAELTSDELDSALTELLLTGQVIASREQNPAALSRADREAALDLNGSPRHWVTVA
jgi:hypothetical protein